MPSSGNLAACSCPIGSFLRSSGVSAAGWLRSETRKECIKLTKVAPQGSNVSWMRRQANRLLNMDAAKRQAR
eukprot:6460543-Amphidinium_carterae.2